MPGCPGGFMGEAGSPCGTWWNGAPTPTGIGTRPPRTSPEQLFALWQATVARSRFLVAEALAERRVETVGPAQSALWSGTEPALDRVHMIDEYARHNGHAHLFRESVDRLAGE